MSQTEVCYEDIDQFQPQASISQYEDIITAEPCPAYATTTFNKAFHPSDEDINLYELVQP